MYQAVIPEDPRHPVPGDQVPPGSDTDEEISDDPMYDDEPEVIDEPDPELPDNRETDA